jgi:ABC-type polar amino acid transport system ATPase subunit
MQPQVLLLDEITSALDVEMISGINIFSMLGVI